MYGLPTKHTISLSLIACTFIGIGVVPLLSSAANQTQKEGVYNCIREAREQKYKNRTVVSTIYYEARTKAQKERYEARASIWHLRNEDRDAEYDQAKDAIDHTYDVARDIAREAYRAAKNRVRDTYREQRKVCKKTDWTRPNRPNYADLIEKNNINLDDLEAINSNDEPTISPNIKDVNSDHLSPSIIESNPPVHNTTPQTNTTTH